MRFGGNGIDKPLLISASRVQLSAETFGGIHTEASAEGDLRSTLE
jgi:hypothetical protein